MTKQKNYYPLLVLAAALLFSFGGFLLKLVSWHPMAVSAGRSMVAAVEILVYMAIRRHKLVINKAVLLGGAAMGLSSTFYVLANRFTTAANAILIQFTAPIFIILFMWMIFKVKPGRLDITATVILFSGMVLFFLESLSGEGMLGNIMALLSGITYALVFMMKQFDGSDTVSSVFVGCVIASVLGLPWLVQETEFTAVSVGGMILIGLIQFGAPYICLAEGLVGTPPVAASLISMIEPVLNPILAAIVVHERLGVLSLIGAAIVIAGSLIYNVLKEYLKQRETKTELTQE
ncbi:MAG: EamA family transporter [Clostridia bacterium]|nr:EamA family transporter [Clostridia bacterium]